MTKLADSHCLQCRSYTAFNFISRDTKVFETKKNFVLNKVSGYLTFNILKYRTNLKCKFSRINVKGVGAVNFNASVKVSGVMVGNQSVDAVTKSCLSRTRFSDDSYKAALFNFQRYFVQLFIAL